MFGGADDIRFGVVVVFFAEVLQPSAEALDEIAHFDAVHGASPDGIEVSGPQKSVAPARGTQGKLTFFLTRG